MSQIRVYTRSSEGFQHVYKIVLPDGEEIDNENCKASFEPMDRWSCSGMTVYENDIPKFDCIFYSSHFDKNFDTWMMKYDILESIETK